MPVLFARQTYWPDWIADRFNGQKVRRGCATEHKIPASPVAAYQKELAFFIEYPLYDFGTA